MRLAAAKLFFANWRQWELNPIVVKELRQAVRSWAVTGTLFLFLAVLFVTSLVFVVGQGIFGEVNPALGRSIFGAYSAVLSLASILFIPLYLGVRLAYERRESNLDLLYVSTLSPGRIIRGKMLCGAYLAILFFSACMPFMAFTTLLRGVDLPTIFCILLFLFMAVVLANQVAIFVACLPVSRVFKVLCALAAFLFTLTGMGPLSFGTVHLMEGGAGAMLATAEFWKSFATTAFIELAVIGGLYFLSVGLISPPSANRALPIRIYVTFIWAVGFVAAAVWAFAESDIDCLEAWLTPSVFVIGISLAVVVSNHDTLSLRVRRTIPTARRARAVAFLFYNGAAGGLVWLAGLAAMTWLLAFGVMAVMGDAGSSGYYRDFYRTLLEVGGVLMYLFAYALSGLLLHRKFLLRFHPKVAGIVTFLMPAFWAVGPVLILFFINQLQWNVMDRLILGSLFNIFSHNQSLGPIYSHLAFAAGWAVLMALLSVPWFLRQVKAFQPLQPRTAAPLPAAAPELAS